jgi:hypothetical protein
MRKLIIATAALAFLSSTAVMAQDKAGSTSTAPAATSGDTMSKGDTMKMSKTKKKSKKSAAKKTGDDTMQKQ